MRARTTIGIGAAVVAAGLGASAWDQAFDTPPPAPLSEVRLRLTALYRVGEQVGRIPADAARDALVRTTLDTWLATLPLDDATRERLRARVDAPEFVDEMVPFALFLKEMYGDAPRDDGPFAAWARANVAPDAPGAAHSLFSFTPAGAPAEPPADAAPGDGAGASFSPELAAKLLALYDAVWLQGERPTGDRLQCDRPPDLLEPSARRAEPFVRDILRAAAGEGGGDGSDVAAAVDAVLSDDETLATLTLSLVELVDTDVCRHYRVYAKRVQRTEALRAWSFDALDAGDPELWGWLGWAQDRRRAVHFVVDGLQGHLVQGLAVPGSNPYLGFAAAQDGAIARPALASAAGTPSMATTFLHHVADGGARPPGYLPTLAGLYADGAPGIAVQGLSTTPTISVRNLPIAFTGATVAGADGRGTGIPNFHWVDRTWMRDGQLVGRPWYFYGNDALALTHLARSAGMKSMFDRLADLDTMSCGAQYDEAAGWSYDALVALALGEHRRDLGDSLCLAELRRRGENERRLHELRAELLDRAPALAAPHHPWELYDRWTQRTEREHARELLAEVARLTPVGMPDYLLYYSPWPDHFAHGKGPYSDEVIGPTGELARLDYWITRVQEAYAAAQVQDRTLYGMAGDHGLTPVQWRVDPAAEVFGPLAARGIDVKLTKISSDEGEGPKLTHPLRPPPMKGYDVVVASTAGGNYMLDLFVDQGDQWARQPIEAELRGWTTLDGHSLDLVAQIVDSLGDSLDYLAVRETTCFPELCAVRVEGTRPGPHGPVPAVGRILRRAGRIHYRVEGLDPLGLGEPGPGGEAAGGPVLERCLAVSVRDPDAWCTEAEWSAATVHGRRPDAVVQLAHLYDTDRAGTINLFPRDGVGYNTVVPGRHAGESFAEKDAFVGVWGAPVAAAPRLDHGVNGQVAPTLFRWITGERPEAGTDGWGYDPLPVTLE